MVEQESFRLGIVEETKTPWERRVAFIPSDVRKIVERGIKVIV